MKEWDSGYLEHELLQTHYSEEEAIELQLKWREKYRLNKDNSALLKYENIQWVAGVDISFPKIKNPIWGIACATLLDLKEKRIITSTHHKGELPFSYIPGLLGFRESRLITQALLKLPKVPDIILCDGHGFVHPREFGEAIHLGLALNIPTVGIAKTMFIGKCDWKILDKKKGNKTPIIIDGVTKGYAICLVDDHRPVFISSGFLTDIELALKISMETTIKNKQPEPIFKADQISRKLIQNNKDTKGE